MNRMPTKLKIILLLFVLANVLVRTKAACGDPGQAYFRNEDGPTTLRFALNCLLTRKQCQVFVLPDAAKGANSSDSSNVKAYYGRQVRHWCTSRLSDFTGAFVDVKTFNEPLDWDVSNATRLDVMFYGTAFNQDVSSWNTSKVRSFFGIFAESDFNQDLSTWDTSKAVSFSSMFMQSLHFNRDLSMWNTSRVRDFSGMFLYSYFNQDLSVWDVSQGCDFSVMFYSSAFNQDLNAWAPQIAEHNCTLENGKMRSSPNVESMFEESACPVRHSFPVPESFCQCAGNASDCHASGGICVRTLVSAVMGMIATVGLATLC